VEKTQGNFCVSANKRNIEFSKKGLVMKLTSLQSFVYDISKLSANKRCQVAGKCTGLMLYIKYYLVR
jgi:hypothetical protein